MSAGRMIGATVAFFTTLALLLFLGTQITSFKGALSGHDSTPTASAKPSSETRSIVGVVEGKRIGSDTQMKYDNGQGRMFVTVSNDASNGSYRGHTVTCKATSSAAAKLIEAQHGKPSKVTCTDIETYQ